MTLSSINAQAHTILPGEKAGRNSPAGRAVPGTPGSEQQILEKWYFLPYILLRFVGEGFQQSSSSSNPEQDRAFGAFWGGVTNVCSPDDKHIICLWLVWSRAPSSTLLTLLGRELSSGGGCELLPPPSPRWQAATLHSALATHLGKGLPQPTLRV